MTTAIRIIGRSSSHFTRVARIFAHELGLPFELVVVHDLTRLDAAAYGGHPALKVPTLHLISERTGERTVLGTENICRALAELAGRAGDRRVVLAEHVADDLGRSAQELTWHAMAAQVQLRVGLSMAELPPDNLFFVKATAGLKGSLAWLETHLPLVLSRLPAPRDVSVLEVTLFCLVEHLAFRPSVPLEPYPRLRSFATSFGDRDAARKTSYRFDPPPEPAIPR